MFEKSKGEWVAGLDVDYTTVLGREKDLKEEEKMKPTMIQVCLHDLCLVYHICHADIECQDFKNFLKDKTVKFITVDFGNDKEVLRRHGICGRPSISHARKPGSQRASSSLPPLDPSLVPGLWCT